MATAFNEDAYQARVNQIPGYDSPYGNKPSAPTPMASTAPKTPASDPQSRINEQMANAQRQRAEGIAAVQRGQAYDSITQQQRQQAYDTWQSTRQPGILPQPRSDMRQQEAEKAYSDTLAGRIGVATPSKPPEQLAKQLGGLDRHHAQNVQLQAAATQQSTGQQVPGLSGVYKHGEGQYSDNAQGMGLPQNLGQPSAQNMQAANNLAGQEQKRSMMSVMREQQEQQQMQQPRGFAAPQIQHSGNSSTSKDELRRLRWAAESAMANAPRKKYAMQDPAVMAYQTALKGDTDARYGGQAALEAKTNDTNAGLQREQMQQQGANQRDASRLVTEQQRLTHDQRQQAITNDLAERRLALDDRKAGTANVPSGYRASADGQGLEAIPGGPADPRQKNKPLNETQSKSLAFGARMQQSGEQLNALAEQGVTQPGSIKRAADAVGAGVLANWTQSGEQQQVEQSQRDYVNAVLRRESGAAISNAEFDNARQQYFPQPGDKPQVIEQKRRNRLLSTQAMLAEVPNSAERLAQLEQMIGGSSTAPNLSQGAQDGQGGQPPQRRVARTGTHNGRRVVQYEDGSLSYAD